MTRAQAKVRILRALKSGPLYEGALMLVVGPPDRTFYRALRELRQAGEIERCPRDPMTWRLA